MPMSFATKPGPSIPLFLISPEDLHGFLTARPKAVRAWLSQLGFTGKLAEAHLVPGPDGKALLAVVGAGDAKARIRGRFQMAAAARRLPDGLYELAEEHYRGPAAVDLDEFALGWLLAGYSFDRYATQAKTQTRLRAPKGIDVPRIEAIAAGEALTRDLINTPASDMGPEELEVAFFALAKAYGAIPTAIRGEDLLAQNLPMIHAVGRASHRAPRLLDMRWGSSGPRLTLVGKGVCFDTGGLNLKPESSIGLMKKDMGGAATVLGLAQMIMVLKLPLRLRVLVPAVENVLGGSAYRPQDILTSRKGLTVEINNTDAEGRLVLADALTLADEEAPDMLISMATLTGAARVAVGPDLAPFFTDDEDLAAALNSHARAVSDPVWRLPFWDPYEAMIEPGIADLDNAPKGGFAGAITAALFLRRFVENTPSYAHFDIYGWQPSPAPARPKGGVGQGNRALLAALPDVLDL